ncbi:MAG: hypothetical protein QE493_06635 [Verrucomicrobiae bacterium]|nr:hypothetical protein [Verrucomicrobiae bacterium]
MLLGRYETYSRRRNPSPPCLHQDSRRLATNQYEICGLMIIHKSTEKATVFRK